MKRRWSSRPPLTESQILAWADAFHERTGKWPEPTSGCIAGALGEKWINVNQCLRTGCRGLPGGSSLTRLLAREHGVRKRRWSTRPTLTESQILAWADAFHEHTGTWPKPSSGCIAGALGETWINVNQCLSTGFRGLPGGSTLTRLLARERGLRIRPYKPLTTAGILCWADAHQRRTGRWPNADSGPIQGDVKETWHAVDAALWRGNRSLPGGSSLARLLQSERGVRNRMDLPPFHPRQILAWADAFHERTGQWPTARSGPIQEAPGESWQAVAVALFLGRRSLPGGSSLALLLQSERGLRNPTNLPPLQPRQILEWADAHRQRTGQWPTARSGPIQEAPGETWCAVQSALHLGSRSLPGGSSLARLLQRERGVRNHLNLPPFQPRQILAWADAHRQRTGKWPTQNSGPVQDAPGETWRAVQSALYYGARSLPGGSSLARLLQSERGVSNRTDIPPPHPR